MNVFERHKIKASVITGCFFLWIHWLLPPNASHILAALLLAVIAAIYFGFALADGRETEILIEGFVLVVFVGFCLGSLLFQPLLLPVGYLAHAVWDWLHHTPVFKVTMPKWYVPYCVIVDVSVGLGLWLIWFV